MMMFVSRWSESLGGLDFIRLESLLGVGDNRNGMVPPFRRGVPEVEVLSRRIGLMSLAGEVALFGARVTVFFFAVSASARSFRLSIDSFGCGFTWKIFVDGGRRMALETWVAIRETGTMARLALELLPADMTMQSNIVASDLLFRVG